MGKLEGKVALVTGGSTGIGFASAKLFVEEGAFVYITGRRDAELEEAVKSIGSEHVKAIRGDVSKLNDLDELFTIIKEEKGRLDVVFANAGIPFVGPLSSCTEEEYYKVFDINVKGVLFTIQKSIPLLSEHASVIMNSSVAGSRGLANNGLYAASKAAVRSFARTLTSEFENKRIRFNVISPGPIDTPIFDKINIPKEDLIRYLSTLIPQRRVGSSEEIAKVVLFLASEDSSFISGIEMCVDGGFNSI